MYYGLNLTVSEHFQLDSLREFSTSSLNRLLNKKNLKNVLRQRRATCNVPIKLIYLVVASFTAFQDQKIKSLLNLLNVYISFLFY